MSTKIENFVFTGKKRNLNSDDKEFHQYQQNKRNLNSDDKEFHQYQQNEQLPLTSNN